MEATRRPTVLKTIRIGFGENPTSTGTTQHLLKLDPCRTNAKKTLTSHNGRLTSITNRISTRREYINLGEVINIGRPISGDENYKGMERMWRHQRIGTNQQDHSLISVTINTMSLSKTSLGLHQFQKPSLRLWDQDIHIYAIQLHQNDIEGIVPWEAQWGFLCPPQLLL